MSLPKSNNLCIPCFKSVAPRIFLAEVPFLGLTRKKKVLVIYMYLKHSSDYIDTKYILVHGFNSLG